MIDFFFGVVDTSFKYDWPWVMKTVGCLSDETRAVVGDKMVRQHIVTQRERISKMHLCFSVQCVFQEPELCGAS